jgi:16S rRNA (guanine527-N7)-methyltransferase
VKHRPSPDVLRDQAAALGVDLSPAAAGSLLRFETLLLERAVPAGMIAGSDAPRLRRRHVLDCLRAVRAVRAGDRTAVDLGSGAGLPGMVVAIAVPDLSVTLVEVRRRRAAFLELAAEQLELANVMVAAKRLEDLTGEADLCFARAFAPLPEAWAAAERLLGAEGRLVYFAGSGSHPPFGAPGARVLEVREAQPLLESAGSLVIMAR